MANRSEKSIDRFNKAVEEMGVRYKVSSHRVVAKVISKLLNDAETIPSVKNKRKAGQLRPRRVKR